MSSERRQTTAKLDPVAWSRVYDDPGGPGQHFIFRRSVEMTFELCEPFVHSGGRWLDAGCGTGHLIRLLHRKGAYVIGVDRDERMLAFTRQSSTDFPAPVVAATAEALPCGDASLDGVVATSLAGCLPQLGSFLAETHRVLREDGHALITFTNRSSLLLRLNYLGAREPGDGERYRSYVPSQVVPEFKSAGFRIETVKFYNFVLHGGNWLFPPAAVARRADALFGKPLGPGLARNFVVVARKTLPHELKVQVVPDGLA